MISGPSQKDHRGDGKSVSLISLAFIVTIFLLFSQVSLAGQIRFDLPVKCTPGSDCFIQNYFDHGAGDYMCGSLTYRGHHGTDIRLRDMAAMQGGVPVLAAAPGTVKSTRDGEPDINIRKRGKGNLGGRDAGNGVLLDHGDGWTTQYSHMMNGSVKVRKGDKVKTGDILGMVGLSGNTMFPHLHFGVKRDLKDLDPFNPESAPCGKVITSLWSDSAAKKLVYQPTVLLISGFSVGAPVQETAEDGGYNSKTVPADSESLVFWVELIGLRKDDRLTIEILYPDGKTLSTFTSYLPKEKARWFSHTGKRRKDSHWQIGRAHV